MSALLPDGDFVGVLSKGGDGGSGKEGGRGLEPYLNMELGISLCREYRILVEKGLDFILSRMYI